MYLVPDWIERSTPFSKARKWSGLAQVLSITTTASWACATAAMAGMSWISKVSEPGLSTNTARVLACSSAAMPDPIVGS